MEKKHIIIKNGPVLVIMVGPSGAGKSTFVDRHFDENEVVSSDDIRQWLTGDFRRQDKNPIVFAEYHHRINTRLAAGQRVVADATHLRNKDRVAVADIARQHGAQIYYVVVNRPVEEKILTGGWRNEVIGKDGITLIGRMETAFLSNEKAILSGDSDPQIEVVDLRNEYQTVSVAKPLSRVSNIALKSLERSGYKRIRVIADVHGNFDGLVSILKVTAPDTYVIFLGDIVDFGEHSWECADLVYQMVSCGKASMVRGNHDRKMHRYLTQMLAGQEFTGQITHGMDISTEQLANMPVVKRNRVASNYIALVEQSVDWIELGDWLFVHAAAHRSMFGNTLSRASGGSYLETMCLYGETDGTTNDRGFPNRTYEWVEKIPDSKNVCVGHQIMSLMEPEVRRTPSGGRVVFLDTGSSKDIDGVSGFLSFWDMEIDSDTLVGDTTNFGRE